MELDISVHHPFYENHITKAMRCRHCYDGTDSVKEQGEVYLPSLGGQTLSEYEAYIMRALFYNATRRTVKGLTGAIMRKEPQMKYPEKIQRFIDNCDGKGTSLEDKIPQIIEEVLITGRLGVFVDRTADGSMPYMVTYPAESCINWLENDSSDITTSVFEEVLLRSDKDNPYKQQEIVRYREVSLNDEGGVSTRIWDKKDKRKKVFMVTSETELSNKGRQLKVFPVTYITASGKDNSIDNPPVLDIVDVNLSHYRSYADLEHGRHWTALPTPWFSGMELGEDENITIGAGSAVILEDPSAKAGFLEFTGSGLQALREALDQKEKQMAVLGARMIESKREGVEAAETARIGKSGEVAALSEVAKSISAGLTRMLRIVAYWEGFEEEALKDINVELNTDFYDSQLSHHALGALVEAYQSGALSIETFLYNLQKGEILPPGTDLEDEKQIIELNEEKRLAAEMAELGESVEAPDNDSEGFSDVDE